MAMRNDRLGLLGGSRGLAECAGIAAGYHQNRGPLHGRKLQMARQMYEKKTIPVRDICKALGIPRSTFYKYVKNYLRR
jgi:hypothetical protein